MVRKILSILIARCKPSDAHNADGATKKGLTDRADNPFI
jgi:hypothetical protein